MPIAEDPSTKVLGNISAGRKITTISVEVEDAFTGYTQIPYVTVGTDADPDQFLTENDTDFTGVGTYFVSPEYVYPSANTSDMVVNAYLNHFGSATGNVTVRVTYI